MSNTPRLPSRRGMAGFNLVEIAIALVIIGFLLTGGLMALQGQAESQQIRETQKTLEDAREALIGFAASTTPPHLPCPDKTGGGGAGTANDGAEDSDSVTGICATLEGNLPWATLGLSESSDRWGNRLRYRVTAVFAAGPTLTSAGDITVRDASGGNALASAVPAVILSHGRNGLGATTTAGTVISTAGAGADELANTDGDTTFVSHTKTEAGAAGGAFDDQVIWLTPNILFNRLIQAGRLP